jgi:hypothetical protein
MLEKLAMGLKGRKEVEIIWNFGNPDKISGP